MHKRIHLHIGTHKTGTTALQQTLAENRELLAQEGFLYPRTGWHQFAQHLLAFEKKGKVNTGMNAEMEGVWEALRAEVENFSGTDVIISSEEFSTLADPSALRAELADYPVSVYIYLRRQDAIFESIYNQQTKDWLSPRVESLEECLAAPEMIYPLFDYYALLTRWADIFGMDNLVVRNYSQLRHQKISTVNDFFPLLGIDPESLATPAQPMLNHSVSRRAMELVRLSKLAGLGESQRQRIFELALEAFGNNDGGLLEARQRENLLKRYKKSNRKLKAFGIQFDTQVEVSPSPGQPLSTLDLVRLLGERV